MTTEQALWELVQGIDSGRVFPGQLPEGTGFPAIVFSMIPSTPLHSQTSTVRNPQYRFDVWATDYDTMIANATSVIAALDHHNGGPGDIAAVLVGEQDMHDEVTGLFRRILDFSVWGN